jgi:hypothetical protein
MPADLSASTLSGTSDAMHPRAAPEGTPQPACLPCTLLSPPQCRPCNQSAAAIAMRAAQPAAAASAPRKQLRLAVLESFMQHPGAPAPPASTPRLADSVHAHIQAPSTTTSSPSTTSRLHVAARPAHSFLPGPYSSLQQNKPWGRARAAQPSLPSTPGRALACRACPKPYHSTATCHVLLWRHPRLKHHQHHPPSTS